MKGLIARLEQKFKHPQLEFIVTETNDIASLSTVRVILGDKMVEMWFINLLHLDLSQLLIQLGAKVYEEIPKVKKTREKHNVFELVEKFNTIHGDKFSYADILYEFKDKDVIPISSMQWIKCRKHNHYFRQTLSNHLIGGGYACPICLQEYQSTYKVEKVHTS